MAESENKIISGSCNCRAITFEINGKIGPIGQCHCSKCRKASGTDGNAVCYTSADSLRWVRGEEVIHRYADTSGPGWSHSFCRSCGSPVPNISGNRKIYFVPAGSFDDDPGYRGYAAHIYVASKAPWVTLCDNAPQFPEGFE